MEGGYALLPTPSHPPVCTHGQSADILVLRLIAHYRYHTHFYYFEGGEDKFRGRGGVGTLSVL